MYTPKEKAIQLIKEFNYVPNEYRDYEYDTITKIAAIKCALICVEEIIKSNSTTLYQSGYTAYIVPNKYYWQEVIDEINKL